MIEQLLIITQRSIENFGVDVTIGSGALSINRGKMEHADEKENLRASYLRLDRTNSIRT